MNYLFPFLLLLVCLHTPISYAQDQQETEPATLQYESNTEETKPENNLTTLEGLAALTDSENDALKFRWLSHQRESLTLELEKLQKEINALENTYADFDKLHNKKFEDASREVEAIDQKIWEVKQTIYDLQQKQAIAAETDETAQTQLSKALEQQNTLLDIHEKHSEQALYRLNEATSSVQHSGGQIDVDIEQKKEELNRMAARRFAVETQVSELLNRDSLANSFRVQISIAFTVLVAIVILGFYWLAIRKDDIAKNIFVGEKGIQFITLFLIVIAIILFGIMGTLEGRELSALLGALAGYILGKTTAVVDKESSGNQNWPADRSNVPESDLPPKN